MASESGSSVDGFIQAGHGDGSEDWHAVVEAGEHGAEEWDALDE